jgi:hypothetical protein
MRSAWWIAIMITAACGGSGPGPGTPDGGDGPDGTPGVDGVPGIDAAPGDWTPLITAGWSLGAGAEGYLCASRTLDQDYYIGAIRPVAPLGTHHTVVSVGDPAGPDDPGSPCGPMFGNFYAAGVGTGTLELPDGVGLIAQAGQQVTVNLHLFNASDQSLAGTSGVEVRLLPAAEVEHVASITFYGPFTFTIPATGTPYSVSEDATASGTIVGLFPHMHQLGSHFTAELIGPSGTTTLWDEPYQFESQEFAAIGPIDATGMTLRTTCTWINDTGGPVSWGDSSNAEMCFAIVMRY